MSKGPAQEPPPMSRGAASAYIVGLPVAFLTLIFVPAGSIDWTAGWAFVLVVATAFAATAIVLARVNPVIYRARSRFQPGTESWDKALLALLLPSMILILPLGAADAGRFHWSAVPFWFVLIGYAAVLAGIALTGWAQAVNPFFEPGVRIQPERHQRVIEHGPYGAVRHPGYVAAIMLFFGMAAALGSLWALIPAAFSSTLLVIRTLWEDRLLQEELPGYPHYTRRVRSRLIPGVW